MDQQTACDHRWVYFVNVATRDVRVRQCEHCGLRALILEPRNPEKQPAAALRIA